MTNKNADVTVRDATGDDLDRVLDLWAELIDLHHDLDGRVWERKPDGKDIFREWLTGAVNDEDRMVLVAEADGRVVGFINGQSHGSPPPLMDRTTGTIDNLAVDVGFRGKGIGRELIAATRQWFADHGAEDVTVRVAARNTHAVGFYEALGFEHQVFTLWASLESAQVCPI
jgi:ribosomal protein S18 acetylase RimI-like enzyme